MIQLHDIHVYLGLFQVKTLKQTFCQADNMDNTVLRPEIVKVAISSGTFAQTMDSFVICAQVPGAARAFAISGCGQYGIQRLAAKEG